MSNINAPREENGLSRHLRDFEVQVIYRYERFERICRGPVVRRLPFIEAFGPVLEIGAIPVSHICNKVMSNDGVTHEITVNAVLFFDPFRVEGDLLPRIVKNAQGVVRGRATRLIDFVVRKHLREIRSDKLRQPGTITRIEDDLKQVIKRDMAAFGVTLVSTDDNLYIKDVQSPERMQAARTEASSVTETIESLGRQELDQLKRALLAHLLRDIGENVDTLQIRSMTAENLIPSDDRDLKNYRNLNGPTGKIYAN